MREVLVLTQRYLRTAFRTRSAEWVALPAAKRRTLLERLERALQALEDEHRARLAEYLEAGGRLIMVGDFATFDRHGRRRGDPGKERLPANCRERAHTFAIEPQRYLEERWARRGGDTYASRLGRELASLCAPAQQQGPPWAVVSKEYRGPWLRAMQPGRSSGHWLCAALPTAALAGERNGAAGLGRAIYGEKSTKEIAGDAPGIALNSH